MKNITYNRNLYLKIDGGVLTIHGEQDESITKLEAEIGTTKETHRSTTEPSSTRGRTKSTSRNGSCTYSEAVAGSSFFPKGFGFYVGINSEESTTVHLPETPEDGTILVIKSERSPPLGNRTITIKPTTNNTVDGYRELYIAISHGCKTLLFHSNNWNVV